MLEYSFDPHFMEMEIFKSFEIEMKNCLKLKTHYDDINGIYSVQLYEFDVKHEEDEIEAVMASIAPLIKSISLLPHTCQGSYYQMPEEGITEEEYNKRVSELKKIDWSKFSGSNGMDEKFCTSDQCELQPSTLITG
jgi:hypothetical protein